MYGVCKVESHLVCLLADDELSRRANGDSVAAHPLPADALYIVITKCVEVIILASC